MVAVAELGGRVDRGLVVSPSTPPIVEFTEPAVYSHEAVVNPDLKHFLEVREQLLIQRITDWPVLLSKINSQQFYDVLGLKWNDLQLLIKGVRQHQIIPTIPHPDKRGFGGSTVQTLDRNRMRAFLAYTWGFRNKLQERDKDRGNIPWEEIAEYTKKALGVHPLIIFLDRDFAQVAKMPAAEVAEPKELDGTVIQQPPTEAVVFSPEVELSTKAYSYEGVVDPRMQRFLRSFEKKVPLQDLFKLRAIRATGQLGSFAGLEPIDSYALYTFVRMRHVIDFVEPKYNQFYFPNLDAMRAFAALACVSAEILLRDDLVTKTKKALGNHQLASSLREPSLQTEECDGRPEKDELLSWDRKRVLEWLNGSKQKGKFSYERHSIPRSVVRTAISIYKDDARAKGMIPLEFPTSMPLWFVEDVLELCVKYMERYPKIGKNLRTLRTAIDLWKEEMA